MLHSDWLLELHKILVARVAQNIGVRSTVYANEVKLYNEVNGLC